MADDFQWHDEEDGRDVVLPEQLATAIYANPAGGVVIRQKHPDGDDDPFVVIRPEFLEAVIEKLRTFLPTK